ncbi:MAG: RnfABCDGE type electron transport complex subunit D [Faecousia sp.]
MRFPVTSSPHIHGRENTTRIMADVCIALLPALAVGILQNGPRALTVTLVSILAAVTCEGLFRLLTRQHNTLPDLSALVTGFLLAMTLPATVPYWVAALGAAFAVLIAKGLCGGLGKNPFNPALAGRALLLLVFPVYLIRYPAAGTMLPLGSTADVVSSATPLHAMQMPALPEASLLDLFLGRAGGCIGEVSALALLLGGAYLVIRRVISPRIPLCYVGTVAVLTLIFHKTDSALSWMLCSVLSGGLLLGAIFMATDYASSPVTSLGQMIYGVGCGVLTVVFRYTGLYPEGVTYAILLMNAAVSLIDRWTAPVRFGTRKGGQTV